MTTTKDKDTGKKPLKLNRPGKLELNKTVKKGPVQQSFSHGRSKTVEVEVKRKRVYKAGDGGRMSEVVGKPGVAEAEAALEQQSEKEIRDSLKGLTPAERDVAWFTLKGFTNAEIARFRDTSEGTVKAQSYQIYRKAGVAGRPQLLSMFIEDLLDAQPDEARRRAVP